jgi:drug/metabolite transporter (DMT)-like permease
VSVGVLVVWMGVAAVTGSHALGSTALHLSHHDLLLAVIAGVAHVIGVAGIYWALARGPAAVVAPITAVIAASLPVTVGLLRLGVPSLLVSLGIFAAVLASVLLSGPGRGRTTKVVFAAAIVAGIGFALQPTALGTVHAPGVPVVMVSEVASLVLIGGWLLWSRMSIGGFNRLLVACGTTRVLGTALFTLAAGHDLRSAAAVSSLYPAATVLLAWRVDREHMSRIQLVGGGLALIALVSIALGA